MANEEGFITLGQLEELLKRLAIVQNDPDMLQLYLRVSGYSITLYME